MTEPEPDYAGRKRRVLLWMAATVAANAAFDVLVGLPYDDIGFAVFATTGLAAFFAFAWVRVDTQERGVKLGAWGAAVALLTKFALPAYFVLSRGWWRGALASAWTSLIIVGLLGLYLGTVKATLWLTSLFGA